jgi:hypothetical protein
MDSPFAVEGCMENGGGKGNPFKRVTVNRKEIVALVHA